MLNYFIKKVTRQRSWWSTLFRPKPSVVICVPAEITSVEERAVRDAAKLAGAKSVDIIERTDGGRNWRRLADRRTSVTWLSISAAARPTLR